MRTVAPGVHENNRDSKNKLEGGIGIRAMSSTVEISVANY